MQFWYFHPLKSVTELQTEGVQCFVFSTQSNRPWVFNVEKKMIGSRKVRLWKRFAKFGICEKYIWNEMYLAVRDWRHRKKWGVAWFKTAVRNSNACSGCLQKIVGSRYSCQLKTALNKLMEGKTKVIIWNRNDFCLRRSLSKNCQGLSVTGSTVVYAPFL